MSVSASVLLREIADREGLVRVLNGEIRFRRARLKRMVVEGFNAESGPIDGITVVAREVEIGERSCGVSPIGRCAYSERGLSLPAQRAQRGSRTSLSAPLGCDRTDACLFCGRNPRSTEA